MSANDTHRIYLECVRPDIGKKGMNKYYLVERNGNKDKMMPRGKTMKDSKTGQTIPKPPYKIVSEQKGFIDLSKIRGRLGIMNHRSMDLA